MQEETEMEKRLSRMPRSRHGKFEDGISGQKIMRGILQRKMEVPHQKIEMDKTGFK